MAPPPPPAGYPPPAYTASYGQPTDSFAVLSLILGILAAVGICCYGIPAVVLGPLAIYFGRASLGRIRASGGVLGGSGMATAGWIIGLVAAIVGGLFLLLIVGTWVLTGALILLTPSASPTPG